MEIHQDDHLHGCYALQNIIASFYRSSVPVFSKQETPISLELPFPRPIPRSRTTFRPQVILVLAVQAKLVLGANTVQLRQTKQVQQT
jgi:hypothetical protein